MLVLTRKLQERIHIGENITITVVKIKGNTVRVGIEAPGDVRVIRGEVALRDEAGAAGGIPVSCETQTTPPPAAHAGRDSSSQPGPDSSREPSSHAREQHVTIRRPPLAGVTARKPHPRSVLAEARPDAPSAQRDAAEPSLPLHLLTC